ncbi:MAG: discoidin domain-containing protein, partial [Marinoscillum sp.]
ACFLNAAGNVLSTCGAVGEYLTVSSIAEFADTGGTQSASISTNVSWTASDDQSWISISPTSGSGSGNIDITVSANASSSQRVGSVTVSGAGVPDRTISVTQAGHESPVNVTGVSLTPGSATVGVGGTQQLLASVSPSDASNQDVSYSSNNTSVATVSASGVVTAVAEGTATITVTTDDGGFTDTSIISVTEPSSGTNLALNKTVTGTGTPDGTNVPANLVDDDVTTRWSVSGFPQSATVDLGGTFTLGSTEVTCYSDRAYQVIIEASTNGSSYTQIVDRSSNTTPGTGTSPIIDTFSDFDARYVRITVTGADAYTGSWVSLTELRIFAGEGDPTVAVTGVSLTPPSVTLDEGATQQLTATVTPSDATDSGVSYTSSNTSVATVNSSGVVTAQSAGSATITVTTDDGGYTDSSTITVNDPSTGSNLALSGTASQSSTGYGGVASRAIDGNTAGNWSSGTITHTNAEAYPWWEVDLGSAHSIGDIVIYNRTDGCCIQRLTNFTVSVLTSSRSEVFSQTFTSYPNPSVTLNAGDVSGQIIRVQLEETNMALSLAEVEVNAGAGSGTLSNLALGKSVSVTDEQTENPGSNLVDDDPDSRWSASGFPQSATIDLGASYSISGTEVICFSDRAYQYTIEASTNGSSYSTIVNRSNNSTPGTNSSPITDAFTAVNARYVRITVSGADSYSGSWVSLEEVRVFGNGSGARTVSAEANSEPEFVASAYPVPMSDVLTIEFGDASQFVGLDLLDMSGRIYLSEREIRSQKISLDVDGLPQGIYLIRLYRADATTRVIRISK